MCDSFVGCKYGIHRKFMSVLYWQAGVFHVLLWSHVLLVTQMAPVHLKQAKWLPRRGDSLTHATLLPPLEQCQSERFVLHSLHANNPYALAGGTKGSSDTSDKILQRKPVWAVLKVATFLGCNTEFLVNLMKAQCYWHKRFTIDLSSARFRPSLLYPDKKSTTQTSESAPC